MKIDYTCRACGKKRVYTEKATALIMRVSWDRGTESQERSFGFDYLCSDCLDNLHVKLCDIMDNYVMFAMGKM